MSMLGGCRVVEGCCGVAADAQKACWGVAVDARGSKRDALACARRAARGCCVAPFQGVYSPYMPWSGILSTPLEHGTLGTHRSSGSSGSSGSGSGGGASAAPQCSMPLCLDAYASLVFTSSIFASLPLCHFASLPICLFDLCLFASLPLCHFASLPLCLFASCSLPGMCALRVCAPTHTRSTILVKPIERSKDGIGSGSSSGSSGSADGAGGARTAFFVFVMLCACVATRIVYRGVSNE